MINGCSSEPNISTGNKSILSAQEPQEKSPLELNRLKWNDNKWNNYQFQFEWQCFCLPDYVTPVLVTVSRGVISKVVYVQTDQPLLLNRYKDCRMITSRQSSSA